MEPLRIELRHDPSSAAAARRAVRDACPDDPAELDAILLCTSELVTNALLHGSPPVHLQVSRRDTTVRVEVHDGGAQLPELRRPVGSQTLSGRGLGIVEAVASRWGAEPRAAPAGGGKVAWFEIDCG